MPTTLSDDWIQTEAKGPGRTSWIVVRSGEVVHSGEESGDDLSGIRAYQAALGWTESHCPGIAFHWRHSSSATDSSK